MKGLELSKKYYEAYGIELLEQFPQLLPYIAVGLFGGGSECLGYDDGISADHDFEPGFCILIPDEKLVDRSAEFKLERAYAKLPKEFMGYKRSPQSPVGGNRHGVIRIEQFFKEKVGSADGILTLSQWLTLPEHTLLEATNGEVFVDNYGQLTQIRRALSKMPRDIRLKKLAGQLLIMGQSGQYNYMRCIKRGDCGAAQLSVIEFVKSAIATVFLLNDSYMPYYKWQFCALRALPLLSDTAEKLEYLISSPNDTPDKKQNIIEAVILDIICQLREQQLTSYCQNEAEGHAYSVNNRIKDVELRNLHILAAIQ